MSTLNSLLYASDESKTPNVKSVIFGERLFLSRIIGWNSDGIWWQKRPQIPAINANNQKIKDVIPNPLVDLINGGSAINILKQLN